MSERIETMTKKVDTFRKQLNGLVNQRNIGKIDFETKLNAKILE